MACRSRQRAFGWAAYFAVEPRLDALRRLPQFDALIERVGLEKNI